MIEKMKKNATTPLTFHYEGLNKSGQKVLGDIQANSLVLAKVILHKQGITLHQISQKRSFIFNRINQRITAADITVFSRQLAAMLEAGIPLVQSFDTVAKGHSNQKLKTLIEHIKTDIESGSTLSESLFKHPLYFNELFCHLIFVGEQSGSLDIMLDKIAGYKEKIETLKKNIKKALTYPIAVLVIALMITALLLIFVVPQFDALFKGFGAELPALTQALVYASHFFQSYGYLIFFALGMAVYAFIYAKKNSKQIAHQVDKTLLKLPIIGSIIEKAAIARFSRTLSITFAAGLPLVEALKSVKGATGNSVFSKATEMIKEEVSTGQPLHQAMSNTYLFPDRVIQMVHIGEESGTLEKMLSKLADFYEEDVDNSVESLTHILEPLIMIVLGILVGGLVLAMYLPIFKLGSVI